MITIDGQPSLFLLDLKGKEYPAIAEVNRKKRVNGQREISLSFLYDQINQDFLHDIEFGWKVLFKGEWYTITGPTYSLDGDVFSVGVDAVLSFFVDMNGHYLQDEVEDKSQTPAAYFRELFEDTGYSYALVDNLLANTLNYQANQSKTERFLYGIDRFEGEYKIQGKVAYVHGLVGSDKDVILHEDLNIQDVSIEVDASGFHTWAKGYGDKDEGAEDADYELEVEYASPLASIYGYIEGPAIRDGSYKHKDALIEAVKKQVENSVKISTTITAVDLTNNGYPEMQFEEGDRVWLYVTDLKQNQQVRVVEIDESFDWEGNIVNAQYTLGNEGIAARYKTQQYNTISDFRDIQSGRKTLEFNWLPEAIRRASDIINGNIDSHFSYRAGEIIGINRSNPNGYMRFNTDGIGFSRDGGSTYLTAITYEGIVADAITAGTLRGIVIEGVDIFGGYIQSLNNDNTFWNLGTGLFRMQNANFELGSGASIHFTDPGNRMYYNRTDTEGSRLTRSAGVGVGRSINDRFPYVFLGTSTGNRPHPQDDEYFVGFIANTNARISADGIGNSSVGDVFHVRDNAVSYTKGFEFDLRGSNNYRMRPIYAGNQDYWLGATNNQFAGIYARQMRTSHGFLRFQNSSSDYSSQGFRMDTTYDGDEQLYFRGINSDEYYSLGRPGGWRFRYAYLVYQPDFSSDERLKTGIKEIDKAKEIISALEPIEYRFKLSNKDLELKNQGNMERGLNTVQFGFSAQRTKQVLDDLGIEDQSLVNLGEDNYYGMQTTQIVPLLVADNQDLRKEINNIKEVIEHGK